MNGEGQNRNGSPVMRNDADQLPATPAPASLDDWAQGLVRVQSRLATDPVYHYEASRRGF